MKNKLIFTATTIAVIVAVAFSSCTSSKDDKGSTATTRYTFETDVDTFTTKKPTETTAPSKDQKGEPTETIDAAYAEKAIKDAAEAYSLFNSARPAIDRSKFIGDDEVGKYYLITDKSFNTLDKLTAYLSQFFSDDLIEAFYGIELYYEEDGKLYANDMAVSSEIKVISEKFSVVSADDKNQVFNVTVVVDEDGDGKGDSTSDYEFEREYINNKWLFTSYSCYW
ncbi:MAG: IseA DL-endopeptidase inhibitor family protein [Clostridiales bacterium]|nr:IseA DL-endopeptidase inhibitor family protein [Clostridiales bacterium]